MRRRLNKAGHSEQSTDSPCPASFRSAGVFADAGKRGPPMKRESGSTPILPDSK
ncbi:hypothetical protein [Bacteroides pyogenes]|uniref:hypothetical protein n=1 Tax=Bacteroides pyogenes TaxID=310300 RepID=UPI001652D8FE|nr:hypothetical protein [Bacteroides pyogenes]MCI7069712.1 hypothetical protein [Bacteroides pyogenes]MDY4250560.1 hypothetical protein [Bacteroides pyogenes]MDY5354133.1 hypothetical protein [Bacteroides pyogenes]